MSTSKRQLDKEREYFDLAYKILKQIGAIEDCEIHEREWYKTTGFNISDEDYKNATAILKKDYPEYDDFKTFHAMIKEIYDEASIEDECPYC